jgi:general secretion pathway protein I
LSRSTAASRSVEGFTLIEALIALAIVAVSLSSIGALIATTVRGTRSIEEHLVRLETTRAIVSALPDRDQLVPGISSGALADSRWRLEVSPFLASTADASAQMPWMAQLVILTVQSPAGPPMQISTVRLHRRPAR